MNQKETRILVEVPGLFICDAHVATRAGEEIDQPGCSGMIMNGPSGTQDPVAESYSYGLP
jgi:hypothetical protein